MIPQRIDDRKPLEKRKHPQPLNGARHARWMLIERILALSEAEIWADAKGEWALDYVFFGDEPGMCLCGRQPIREHCIIRNQKNGNTAVVGNICIKMLLGLPSESIFRALRRVQRNPEAALNKAAIRHAHAKGWINDWEWRFYLDTARKRNLTPRQLVKRLEINGRVLARTAGEGL
jgi:hypothetical protein